MKKHTSFKFKIIETRYDNKHFRSRLEARWAVFFNELGIRYCYEHEGYDLLGTWYLPDFWLPDLDFFIEIKPQKPSTEEIEKARLLALCAQKNVHILAGNVDPDDVQVYSFFPPHISAYQIEKQHVAEEIEIKTTPQALYILQQLNEVDAELYTDGCNLMLHPGYLTALIGFDTDKYLETLKKQHDRIQELLPYIEQELCRQELVEALTLEEGWRIDFSSQWDTDDLNWFECPQCNGFDIGYAGLRHIGCSNPKDVDVENNTPRLLAAYKAALEARF